MYICTYISIADAGVGGLQPTRCYVNLRPVAIRWFFGVLQSAVFEAKGHGRNERKENAPREHCNTSLGAALALGG